MDNHASDCALHNLPATMPAACDCGVGDPDNTELVRMLTEYATDLRKGIELAVEEIERLEVQLAEARELLGDGGE